MFEPLDRLIAYLIEAAFRDHQRLYACLLLSVAGAGFIGWLVEAKAIRNLEVVLCLAFGLVVGILWERHA